jgi:SAM-dependent methyltransferase
MELQEYHRIAAAEDDHWWYRNTRGLIHDMLAPHLAPRIDATGAHRPRILDAGCGPGGNGAWLAQHGEVVGADLAAEGLAYVRDRRPGMQPVRASITDLPFPDGTFDVTVEITVVTCVPDDQSAIHELARVTRPGGAVLLFEPAFPALRRAHDAVVHSVHRYTRRSLEARAIAAGLQIRRATYAYSFLVPPAAALAVADRVRHQEPAESNSDVERRSLDRVFAPLAAAERRRLARGDVPFGTSVVVVATRANGPTPPKHDELDP